MFPLREGKEREPDKMAEKGEKVDPSTRKSLDRPGRFVDKRRPESVTMRVFPAVWLNQDNEPGSPTQGLFRGEFGYINSETGYLHREKHSEWSLKPSAVDWMARELLLLRRGDRVKTIQEINNVKG